MFCLVLLAFVLPEEGRRGGGEESGFGADLGVEFGPGSHSPFLPQLLSWAVCGQKISRSLRAPSLLRGSRDWEVGGRPQTPLGSATLEYCNG